MATQTESYLNSSTQTAADDIWPLFLDQNIVTHESCMVTCSWHAHVEQSEIVLSGCIQEIAIPVWTQARDNSYSCDVQMPPRRDAAYDQRNNWSAISWLVSCKFCYLSEIYMWSRPPRSPLIYPSLSSPTSLCWNIYQFAFISPSWYPRISSL